MHSMGQTGAIVRPTVLTSLVIARLRLEIIGACANRDIIRH